MDWIDVLQWPAMVITIAAAWFTAALSARQRLIGFWLFLCSNALWIAWGWSTAAWALVALQVGLALMNIRGASKNERSSGGGDGTDAPASASADKGHELSHGQPRADAG